MNDIESAIFQFISHWYDTLEDSNIYSRNGSLYQIIQPSDILKKYWLKCDQFGCDRCEALSDVDYMLRYVEDVKRGKDYFTAASQQYKEHYTIHPSYGNFVLLEFKSYEDKRELLTYLADHNIFARDTTQAPMVYNCFRITVGTTEQMKHVLNTIDSLYKK